MPRPARRALAACLILYGSLGLGGTDEMGNSAVHLLFWQAQDVLDPEGVTFTAHSFPDDRIEVLLEADEDRPSLWYMPTAAIPTREGVRIYYQRVERDQEDWLQQRTLCMGILSAEGFERPDLGLFEQAWDGPRNVVLQRSPHTPTWGGFNVHQIVRDESGGYVLLYWDQPAEGPAGARHRCV